jgi:hypothetical protein
MVGDFHTKPLQGEKFGKFRSAIIGCDYYSQPGLKDTKHELRTLETRTRTHKMMHTNMRIAVVIEQVEHDQDEETTIIIFEEDINDEYPNESRSKRLPQ